MDNNENFKSGLTISYLDLLRSKKEKDEFDNVFGTIEGSLEELINSCNSKSDLEKLERIIDYRTKRKGNVIK